MYKCIKGNTKVRLTNELFMIAHTHDCNTKASTRGILQVPKPSFELLRNSFRYKGATLWIKVAEDDIAFKLAILNKSLHLNDNTCFCGIIQSSKLVLGSLLAKNNFFVQFFYKKFCILPDGQLWEWLTGGVALPQSKCNWSVGFAIAQWPVGKASDNARIMLSSLIRYSLV